MSDVRDPQAIIAGLKALVEKLGTVLMSVNDGLEDEGDRIFLGSTNHAERVEDAVDWFNEWTILDSLPGLDTCRHGNPSNGSCELCHTESERDTDDGMDLEDELI